MNALSNLTRPKGEPRIIKTGSRSSLGSADRLARTLGWLSVGLGVAEILFPHRVTRALGMQGSETMIRLFGAREIASGIVSLSVDKDIGIWSRLAGDGMDLAALTSAWHRHNPQRDNVGLALALVGGIAALDLFAAQAVRRRHRRPSQRSRNYAHRSGFPRGIEQSRGAASDMAKAISRHTATAQPA